MIFFENIIFYIYVIQGAIIFTILSFSVGFEWSFQHREKLKRVLKTIFLSSIEQNMPVYCLPPHLKQMKIMVPVLEELNEKISGVFWEQLKEEMIHHVLYGEIQANLKKKGWEKTAWVFRAFRLSPKEWYEEIYLKHLAAKSPAVRFLAINGAVQLKTPRLVLELLKQLSSPERYYKFPYIDAFLKGGDEIFEKTLKIFRTEQSLRGAALEILARKAGFLTVEDITPELTTPDHPSRWWAIEALKNIPSQKSVDLLTEETKSLNWKERLHAVYILGLYRSHALETFETLSNDESKEVRLAAGWALSHHRRPIPKELEPFFTSYPSRDIDRYLSNLIQSSR